jgi:hypothetical protein
LIGTTATTRPAAFASSSVTFESAVLSTASMPSTPTAVINAPKRLSGRKSSKYVFRPRTKSRSLVESGVAKMGRPASTDAKSVKKNGLASTAEKVSSSSTT